MLQQQLNLSLEFDRLYSVVLIILLKLLKIPRPPNSLALKLDRKKEVSITFFHFSRQTEWVGRSDT